MHLFNKLLKVIYMRNTCAYFSKYKHLDFTLPVFCLQPGSLHFNKFSPNRKPLFDDHYY